jgi:hypothetical protein
MMMPQLAARRNESVEEFDRTTSLRQGEWPLPHHKAAVGDQLILSSAFRRKMNSDGTSTTEVLTVAVIRHSMVRFGH